jgi:hypothetical protein
MSIPRARFVSHVGLRRAVPILSLKSSPLVRVVLPRCVRVRSARAFHRSRRVMTAAWLREFRRNRTNTGARPGRPRGLIFNPAPAGSNHPERPSLPPASSLSVPLSSSCLCRTWLSRESSRRLRCHATHVSSPLLLRSSLFLSLPPPSRVLTTLSSPAPSIVGRPAAKVQQETSITLDASCSVMRAAQ